MASDEASAVPTIDELLAQLAAVRDLSIRATAEFEARQQYRFNRYFPDDGPLRRELYAKHCQFMAAGSVYRERLFLKANRVGGTETAAYEITCHMTGRYPDWWEGKRFERPVRVWAAGNTMETTRNILQVAMLGALEHLPNGDWSGMLPKYDVSHVTRKGGGVPMCVDQVWVKHVSGVMSVLGLKSYDQGAQAFMGTEQDVIWVDEEPPQEIYTECLMRTMTTQGHVLSTFTPLQGMTPFIQDFIETADMPGPGGQMMPAKLRFWPDGMRA